MNENDYLFKWAEDFCATLPVAYYQNQYWLFNFDKYQYEQVEEIEILNKIKACHQLGDNLLRVERLLLRAVQMTAREQVPPEMPLNKIQFGRKVFDVETKETEDIFDKNDQPRYFTTNAIPHKLGKTSDTPTLDKLFTEWAGKEKVQTLYEIIAYACYRSMPIHIIVVLNGRGRNGKSSYLDVVENFLGEHNKVSTDFERLATRPFETYNLYRKLAATMGETNHDTLKKSSLLKQLSGNDSVPFEKKGVQAFTSKSYALLLVATNALPYTTDTTEGFFRRWVIIDFPNQFEEGGNILKTIPVSEYESLARKVTELLPVLLERGLLHQQGTIQERTAAYEAASCPEKMFIQEYCEEEVNSWVSYKSLYQKCNKYLKKKGKRTMTYQKFRAILDDMGFEVNKTNRFDSELQAHKAQYYVFGLRWKKNISEFGQKKACVTNVTDVTTTPLSPIREKLTRNPVTTVTTVTNQEKEKEKKEVKEDFSGLPPDVEEQEVKDFFSGSKKTYAELISRFDEPYIQHLAETGLIYEPKNNEWYWK